MVSAAIGTLGVVVFSSSVGDVESGLSIQERREAFRAVILFNSLLVAAIGVAVYFLLRTETNSEEPRVRERVTLRNVIDVLRLPSIWLLMAIVLCGYVGYKVTDDLALYASDVMLFDEVKAASLSTMLLYLRPVVGIVVGFLADWTRPIS